MKPITLQPTFQDKLADAYWNTINGMTQEKADKLMRKALMLVALAFAASAAVGVTF